MQEIIMHINDSNSSGDKNQLSQAGAIKFAKKGVLASKKRGKTAFKCNLSTQATQNKGRNPLY